MAYCVLNNFSNQQKNILIMKDSTMPKKYTKQTSEKISNFGGRCDFRKFNSVSMNQGRFELGICGVQARHFNH